MGQVREKFANYICFQKHVIEIWTNGISLDSICVHYAVRIRSREWLVHVLGPLNNFLQFERMVGHFQVHSDHSISCFFSIQLNIVGANENIYLYPRTCRYVPKPFTLASAIYYKHPVYDDPVLAFLQGCLAFICYVDQYGDSEIKTHCGLVTPYGNRDLGQHWLR